MSECFLISPDAMLEASVTAIVGTIFVVTLRQSLGLKVTPKFVRAIVVPNLCFVWVAISSLFLHEESVYATLGINIDWIEYTITRIIFAVGLLRLIWILLKIEGYSDSEA
jgi:hypothetical protein